MPDLVNPENNGGKKEVIRWVDELCGSCSNHGSCPLIQVLCDNVIMTHSGIHISDCMLYVRDASIEAQPMPDPMEQLTQAQSKLKQQISAMRAVLSEALDVSTL
jgi:hypothetical protein